MGSFTTKAGYVAILGRPSVGKSTLLNKILGQKVSITSRKPQTTRHRILGIKTIGDNQVIYVDTPGLQQKVHSKINSYMQQAALHVVPDMDVIIFLIAGLKWNENDELVLTALQTATCPVILAINKVDLVVKDQLLAWIKTLNEKRQFAAIIPISALDGTNIELLERNIQQYLPENPFFFPPEQVTDRDDKFWAAEIIRERLTNFLGQELPHALSIVIDKFEEKKQVLYISATIIVERQGQKAIVIGHRGEMLKKVGISVRREVERKFKSRVFLQLWVKVKADWSNNERLLRDFGY